MEIGISKVRILYYLFLSNSLFRNLSKDYTQECIQRLSNNVGYLYQNTVIIEKNFEKLNVQQWSTYSSIPCSNLK